MTNVVKIRKPRTNDQVRQSRAVNLVTLALDKLDDEIEQGNVAQLTKNSLLKILKIADPMATTWEADQEKKVFSSEEEAKIETHATKLHWVADRLIHHLHSKK